MNLLPLHPEHARQGGTAYVEVEDADVEVLGRQGAGQQTGHRGLADASLAGEDEDLVLHAGQSLSYQGHVRVW